MTAAVLADLWHGFGVVLQPQNFMWCFIGVLIGNVVGVLPGLGVMATISLLLPLTFGMAPVAAIVMLAGIFYGSQYGGAISAILLNLPCHPPHAVTCLDGFQLTRKGRGGAALAITMMAGFIGASFGIVEMIFFAPLLVQVAFKLGPAEIFALMVLGLLCGSTLGKGSAVKGLAMTVVGMMLGLVGSDIETGRPRFTFGSVEFLDGVEIVAMALGLFGIAEFLKSVNQVAPVNAAYTRIGLRDMRPTKGELKEAVWPIFRGTMIGSLCSMVPGTGPTIASFVSYAAEKRVSRTPEKFGTGMIAGTAGPEAATHAAVQGDFIPTMSLGIPGDAIMALLLGAFIIQGITPGPQLILEHPDVFWGLVASFWIGNVMLLFLNIPLIGFWVKLLTVPYRYLYPSALAFVCVGVFGTHNNLLSVVEALCFGVFGFVLLRLGFHPAPIILGYVLGPAVEENFRRAMILGHGDLAVFVDKPISAFFLTLAALLIVMQVYLRLKPRRRNAAPLPATDTASNS